MKKTIKSGIVAAVAVAAGFAAYQSYGSYGAQDNSLLMQNVEALADDNNGEPNGDPGSGRTYYYENQGPHPKSCILYIYKRLDGTTIKESEEKDSKLSASASYICERKDGVKDPCDKKGKGCTPYSCHVIPYVPVQ